VIVTAAQSAEGLGNLLLLAPLASFLILAGARAWQAVVASLVTSAGFEVAQALLGSRDCTATDLVLNMVGAVVGAALGVMVMESMRTRDRGRHRRAL
jgi:glycopeptide antibiotics resistance protein